MGFHYSVMLTETISLLDLKENGIYVDLTLGRGGTSSAILHHIPHGHLYSFDLDEEAITESQERLASVGTNFTILHANFRDFVSRLKEIGVKEVDGITADLGVSSPQFDEAERGFSYREDAPLDMRMNQESSVTTEQIVNQYSYEQLRDVFEKYGEDPYSKAIALAIVKEREKKPILTTGELVDLIKRVKPAKERMKKGHPAKQIFQALRIEANQEMDNLKQMLDSFDSILKPGGRIAILTFQSLEDRMVKDKFRSLTVVEGSREGPDLLPEELPEAPYLALTRKPIVASEKELSENHRSKSAKLRAIQKKQK